ncbi:MAG: VanZ family protein, partial [Eubacteriales bacterium]
IFFVLWVCLVLHLTLFSRSPGDCGVHLRPFDQILTVFAGGSRELLRTFWMNVLLFAPCGFFFPELLPDGWRGRTRCAVNAAFAFLLSLTIELLQWRWCLGEAETDDVLANTFGAFLSFALIRLFGKINWRELCAALYGFFRNLRKPPQD